MKPHRDVPLLGSRESVGTFTQNGLNVVAIHHHMTTTEPAIYFLHYWGTGSTEKLANAFKVALNELGKPAKVGH